MKEPILSLHRFSQRRRRTYSDTESYSDSPFEDSRSKFRRNFLFTAAALALILAGGKVLLVTESFDCKIPVLKLV